MKKFIRGVGVIIAAHIIMLFTLILYLISLEQSLIVV